EAGMQIRNMRSGWSRVVLSGLGVLALLLGGVTLAQADFPDKPDLVITNLTGTVTPFAPDGDIVGTVEIKNTGTVPSPAGVKVSAWVAFDFDWDTALAAHDGDGYVTIGALDPGESVVVDLGAMNLKAANAYGTYMFMILVDSAQDVEEYSEWNNFILIPYEFPEPSPDPKPDLVITEISGTITPYGPGGYISGSATIANLGTATSPAVLLAAWKSFGWDWSVIPGNHKGDGFAIVPSLAPGQSVIIDLATLMDPVTREPGMMTAAATTGAHTFMIVVDTRLILDEYSKLNNYLMVSYHFPEAPPAAMPDLAIVDIDGAINENTRAIEGLVTIANTGTAASPWVRLTAWVSFNWDWDAAFAAPAGDGNKSIGPLAPDGTIEINLADLNLTASDEPGTHTFMIFVDTLQAVTEYSELNNYLLISYSVPHDPPPAKPDLIIEEINGEIDAEGKIVGTVTIANTGTAASPWVRLTAWVSFNWDWDAAFAAPAGDGNKPIGPLAPDGTIEINLADLNLTAATTAGTHTFMIYVDSRKFVDEYSEWNNFLLFNYVIP
ncbi:MAG: CARDB domain-containing protein, partial [Kiritimatiellia bacterium]